MTWRQRRRNPRLTREKDLTVDDAIKLAPLASAIVACLAALIAAGSATFAGIQMRLARRTAVVQVLQSFDKAASDREAALAASTTTDAKKYAFHELMNFLELYAAIWNRRLVTSLARELIRDRLIDSLVVIERAKVWHGTIDRAISHEGTFAELQRFLKKNALIMKARRAAADSRAKALETGGGETIRTAVRAASTVPHRRV